MRLTMVTPQLQNTVRLRRMLSRLESRIADLENALDHISTGLVLLDADGRCLLTNQEARAILDRRDGLSLRRSMLHAGIAGETTRIRELVDHALDAANEAKPAVGRATLVSRGRGNPLRLMISPLPREHGRASGKAAAIALIHDPDQKAPLPAEVFHAIYGFTPAEARLATGLLEGKSLVECALCFEVSRETVRSQLKSMFQKTGSKRQGELIRLLSSVVWLRG